MSRRTAAVIGGGLAGVAAAHALARAGFGHVRVLERGPELGGLAGTFERDGHFYPLAYHHILHRDRALLFYLEQLDLLPRVRWHRIQMLFRVAEGLFNLGNPLGFLGFPMSITDKLRFARLMLRAFGKRDWSDWQDRSAADLIDAWGGPGVREAIFEPLTRLKFDLPCAEASGAWLGARLSHREGSAPLGYIPGDNWTRLLCDGLGKLLVNHGVSCEVRTTVTRLYGTDDRITAAELATGERVEADVFVSTVPTEVYLQLVGHDDSAQIADTRYTAILSLICATRQPIAPRFYWMNLASRDCQAGGIFRLEALNPTIGVLGDSCLNFVTHVPSRDRTLFGRSDDELIAGYHDDFARIFGFALDPHWQQLTRLPMYSPVFVRGYHNPPVRSATWRNVFFAGNYRTFPSVASTGTALGSGLEAAAAILADDGATSDLLERARRFELRSMPRADTAPT